MQNFATRVLHDALANSLGRILDISREQLRVSLWSAWRTGLTLDDVALRCDAFEHLQLPFTLASGRIGRIQAQVPWATLRSLRSAVVVELADIHLCIALRRNDELEEGPASERAWLAKQAELAAAELAALAAASAGGDGDGDGAAAASAVAGRQGGVLASFMQHVVAMLVNRLQLTVSGIHIQFEDPQSGTRIGLQLRRLHTCLPWEAEHVSPLLSQDAGVVDSGVRGIQKQFAIEGLALYWQPGSGIDAEGQNLGPVAQPVASGRAAAAEPAAPPPLSLQRAFILLPTDCVIHSTLQLSATDGSTRAHIAAVVHHLPLSLGARQVADMLALSDRLAWCTARNKYAAHCPTGWRQHGALAVPWRRVWQYAVNSVLHDLRGERQRLVEWRDSAERVQLRKQYVAAYRLHLERRHLGSGPISSASEDPSDTVLPALERRLSVGDILICRQVAQQVLDASLAAGVDTVANAREIATTMTHRARARPLPSFNQVNAPARSRAAAAVGGRSVPQAKAPAKSASSGGSSSAASGMPPTAAASTDGQRRGYLAWGLSKAAGFLRYLPYSASAEGDSAAALPEPTEAELEELYQAVDFHPDEQQAATANAAAGRDRSGGARLHLSLDCLVSSASLLLEDGQSAVAPRGEHAAAAGFTCFVHGHQAGQRQQESEEHDIQRGHTGSAPDSGSSNSVSALRGALEGSAVAMLELERLRLGLQLHPGHTSASLSLSQLSVSDLCSEGPGVSAQLLSRGTTAVTAGGNSPSHATDVGISPPVVRLLYSAVPTAAVGAEARSVTSQERQSQLDVLVQPLLLQWRALCLRRLLAMVPPAVPASYIGCQLATLNALGVDARCAAKARRILQMGPPVDLLVKVLDVELRVGQADCSTSLGVGLRTGPIILHTVDSQQQTAQEQWQGQKQGQDSVSAAGAASQRRTLKRQNTPHHVLTAAEAAAHLSAVIKQRRLATRLRGAATAGLGTASMDGPRGSSLDAAAAVEAVEQRLVYQQFELSVAGLQAAAVNLRLPDGGNSGSDSTSGLEPSSSTSTNSGDLCRQWQPLLQPLRLDGLLKVHRIAEDYSLPQMQCALRVNPVTLSLTQHIVQLLMDEVAQAEPPPPSPPAPVHAAVIATDAQSMQPSSICRSPGSSDGGAADGNDGMLSPGTSSSLAGGRSSGKGSGSSSGSKVAMVALDLQLASLDLRYTADEAPGAGSTQSAAGQGLALEAHVACAGANISLHSMLDGSDLKLTASRLFVHDLSHASLQPSFPPPVHGGPLPHVARLLAVERLSVFRTADFGGDCSGCGMGSDGGGGTSGSRTEMRIELQDLSVEGFAGEAGNFLARLHERQDTHVSIVVRDSQTATHTTVSGGNLLIGHGLLLRLAVWAGGSAQEEQQQEGWPAELDSQNGGQQPFTANQPPPEEAQQLQQHEQEWQQQQQPAALDGGARGDTVGGQVPVGSSEQQQHVAAVEAATQQGTVSQATPPHGPPLDTEPSSLEQWSTAVEELQADPPSTSLDAPSASQASRQDSQSSHATCGSASITAASRHAFRPAGLANSGAHGLEEEFGAAAAGADTAAPSSLPLLPPAPAKQIFTSIHFTDCRLVLRYQPALHSNGGSNRGGGVGNLDVASIPASTHDFLSVHSDLLSLGVPLLHLQLPMDPSSLAAAAATEEWVATGWPSACASQPVDREGSMDSGSSDGTSPLTAAGSSVGWADVPSAAAARKQTTQMAGQQHNPHQHSLCEGHGLMLSSAAVGYAHHTMLPLLQVPSLRLTCTVGSGNMPPLGGSSGGSPATPPHRSSMGMSSAWLCQSTASIALSYCLDVGSLDIGLHPSQLSMLTSAVQLCQHELAVLGREPWDGSGADSDSLVTSTSGTVEQLAAQQRSTYMRQLAVVAAGALPAAMPAGNTSCAAPGPEQQGGASRSPAAHVKGTLTPCSWREREVAPPYPQWRLQAAIGCVGLSMLGATPSSTCLKAEWQELQAICSAGGGSGFVAGNAGPSSPVGGSPAWRQSQAEIGSSSPGSAATAEEQPLAVQLSWHMLSLHVLHPHLSYTHPDLTPFAFASGLVRDTYRQDSQRDRVGPASPQGASPRIFMHGATPAGPEVLYHPGSGPLSAAGTGMGGVRRSLSVGVGLAGTAEEFHDASAHLARTSRGSSRYFSPGSEFEDAASEFEGAQSPTLAHSPPHPMPLPLELGSADYHSTRLLVMHGGASTAQVAPAAVGPELDEPGGPASAGSQAGLAGEASVNGLVFSPSRLHGIEDSSSNSETVVSLQWLEQQRRAAVEINALAVRVHAAGWEDLAGCLHTYTVLAQQAQRQYILAAQARAASPLVPQRPPAAAGRRRDQQLAEEQGSEQRRRLALRLHLQSLLLELLADADLPQEAPDSASSRGSGCVQHVVPACTLQAEVEAQIEQSADGGSQLKVLLPGLLLAVGAVPATAAGADAGGRGSGPPAALALPLQDALLGMRRVELSLMSQQQPRQTQPAATVADGSVLLGPAHQVSVGASLAHISLWANPRNLCATAALSAHMHSLAKGLADSFPVDGGEIDAPAGKVLATTAGSACDAAPPRQLTLKLNVQRVALLLSLLTRENVTEAAPAGQHVAQPTPLLEFSAAALTADVRDMGEGSFEGTLRSELQLATFNAIKLGWEPFIEPWNCRVQFAVPTCLPPPSSHHQRLIISSTQGLELTLTQTALEAAVVAGRMLQAATAVSGDPATLEEHLQGSMSSAACSAAYWLHNQTGSALEVWLAGADSSSSWSQREATSSGSPSFAGVHHSQMPSGPPVLVLQPGNKAVLPIASFGSESSDQHQGIHAGIPCPRQGVARPQQPPRRRSHLSSSEWGPATPPYGATSARHSSRTDLGCSPGAVQSCTALYFRLAGQQGMCGPVHLDRGCFQGCATACSGVFCDMEASRHSGYTLTLHSGVQLRNTTQLALDIGVQTPMGLVMAPQPLGTLRPGGTMWLPALRAHNGLLCLRPAAAAGSAASSAELPPFAPPPPSTSTLQKAASWHPGPSSNGGLSRIPSLAPDSLAAAAALVTGNQLAAAGPAAPVPLVPAQRVPSSPLLYATAGLASPTRLISDRVDTGRQLQAAGAASAPVPAWHPNEWSPAVPLQVLLRQAAGMEGAGGSGRGGGRAALEGRSRAARQLTCASTLEHQPPVTLYMGAIVRPIGVSGGDSMAPPPASAPPSATDSMGSWEVLLSAPLTLQNALPVPVDVLLTVWGQAHRLHLQPNQHAALHSVDAARIESLSLRALGYHPSAPISPPPLPAMAASGPEWDGSGSGSSGVSNMASKGSDSRELVAPDTEVVLQEAGHSRSSVQVFVRHSLDTATGSHKLLFGCALWVFNCTGLPVSLRQSGADGALGFGDRNDAGYQQLPEDQVPESWLPPLELPGQGPGAGGTCLRSTLHSPLQHRTTTAASAGLRAVPRGGLHTTRSTPNSAAPSVINHSRVASTADIAGLSEILDGASSAGGGTTARSGDSRQVLGLKRTVSRARGIADSMEAIPAFETPSRWPSIQGGLQPHRQRLRLQIRATQCQAPPGRTYWSDPVELDALGGAAVVTVPSPLLPPTAAMPAARAAYMMTVTASQVPGSHGALALYLLPRYLLINTLDVPIQYKQQGTQHERELEAGASRALRWSDALRPLRLCVRVQEAGWLWSGGFELDSPGDMFIKIRHRDRGITMLVRVDLAASAASGVLRVTFSHHPAGFAPYRIENCSLETLHARQHKVCEQQDVLRPYCSLNYAWDEPSLPHRLVLELPGARPLGTFDLDKVGQDVVLPVPSKRGDPQRRLRVLVRSEGPTRVLTVMDTQRHSLLREAGEASAPAIGAGAGTSSSSGPSWPPRFAWDAWSLPGLGAGQQQSKKQDAKTPGLLWEVRADLVWLGVSLVAPTREMAYLRVTGLQAQLAGTAAHLVLDLELRKLQLDNPSPWVALPVTLHIPAPVGRLTSTVAAAVDVQRRPALLARLALWQRRPARVLCVEQADLQLAPVAIYVEQQHALQLAEFLAGMSAGLEAAACASASTAGPGRSRGGAGDGRIVTTLGDASLAGSDAPFAAGVPASSSLGAVASEAPRLPGLSSDLQALLSGHGSALLARGEQKVYLDLLRIAPLELTITFLPAPFQPEPGHPRLLALQRVLSLADVEDARLRLAALELRNPLMGTAALAQLLQRHYTRALLPELYKVVGSASVFGDPVRLFHHLGLGVWSFLASPAAGLVESARHRGPRQFIAGVGSGVRGLFQNVVFALSNAATKGSTAGRKAITVLGLDRLHPQHSWAAPGSSSFRRRLRWEHDARAATIDSQGPPLRSDAEAGPNNTAPAAVMFSPRHEAFEGPQPGGDGGVLGALLLGVVGLAAEPVRGLDEGGLLGLLSGIKRGAIGVVVLPLASLLEMSASTADSIRRAVAGSSIVGWVRPPRYVHATQPLKPYSWCDAMGRWLLAELEHASLARHAQHATPARRGGATALQRQLHSMPLARYGSFVLCAPLADQSCYLVVTTKRVLYICAREPMWAPSVRWSCTIADLELVNAQGAQMRLVAQQPLRRHIVRGASTLPRSLADVLKAPRPPFSFLSVECETAVGAQQVQMVLLQLQACIPPLATYMGHCRVLLPPPDD